MLISGGNSQEILIWDLLKLKLLKKFTNTHTSSISAICSLNEN